jgi:hypothetical protein
MKKLLVVLLALTMVCALSTASFGLISPSVSEGHGVLTGALVSSGSFLIGAEYGFSPNFAVGGQFGNNITKLDVKYELNSSLALLGGIMSWGGGGSTNAFIGINGGASINKKFMLIGELDATMIGSDFCFIYEVGGKYNITKQLDIRGGLLGAFGNNVATNTSIELGVGYKF